MAMKVLLADDDRVLTHLLSARLRAMGWTVTVALDAMQAVMFAMRTEPDIIVLDINMPGGTGMSALQKLKASGRTSQIPIVVLSGSIDAKDEPQVRELGAEIFLRKPTAPDDLHRILLNIVQGVPPLDGGLPVPRTPPSATPEQP
jgi:DNA-binding response OmpR family regulator